MTPPRNRDHDEPVTDETPSRGTPAPRFGKSGVMLPWALIGVLCVGAVGGGGSAAGKLFGGDGLEEARKVARELDETKSALAHHLETAATNREHNLAALAEHTTQIATLRARDEARDHQIEALTHSVEKLDADVRALLVHAAANGGK